VRIKKADNAKKSAEPFTILFEKVNVRRGRRKALSGVLTYGEGNLKIRKKKTLGRTTNAKGLSVSISRKKKIFNDRKAVWKICKGGRKTGIITVAVVGLPSAVVLGRRWLTFRGNTEERRR